LETGDSRLAEEARAATQEVSALMARSPHGTETWHLTLQDLFEFESRHGAIDSRKVQATASAGSGALSIAARAEPAHVRPGEVLEIALELTVEEGSYLQAEAFRLEAWGGADVTL